MSFVEKEVEYLKIVQKGGFFFTMTVKRRRAGGRKGKKDYNDFWMTYGSRSLNPIALVVKVHRTGHWYVDPYNFYLSNPFHNL